MLLYYELVGELDNLFVLEFWETTSWDCVTNAPQLPFPERIFAGQEERVGVRVPLAQLQDKPYGCFSYEALGRCVSCESRGLCISGQAHRICVSGESLSCCVPDEAIKIEVMEAEIDHHNQEKKDHEIDFSCLKVEALCRWVSGESLRCYVSSKALCLCVSIETLRCCFSGETLCHCVSV
ncbi:hypothetical protein Bca4012_007227 [Brassica carinata]